jgi:hypothetical protein
MRVALAMVIPYTDWSSAFGWKKHVFGCLGIRGLGAIFLENQSGKACVVTT